MIRLLDPFGVTSFGVALREVASGGISKLNHSCNALGNGLCLIISNLISAGIGILEIEDIALRGDLWSPDTDDWTVDEQNRIVDGVPVITHHYCGKLHNKAKKPDGSDSRIVSWMPLSLSVTT